MVATRSSSSSRFSRGCSRGFSLIEMLVTLTVVGMIAGGAMAIALSSQRMFETDQNRTTINQNLRSGMDLLGIDIRQAGERLPQDMPAIEIVDGASGAPDTIVVRRNLVDAVMPVCKDITAGSSVDAAFIALKKGGGYVPPGCSPVPDKDGDGWPDNLQSWKAYRESHGGVVLVYIFNPTTSEGEFFEYDAEDASTMHIHKQNGGAWQYDYLVDDQARAYILEQLTFQLQGDLLQAVVNGDNTNALNLVSHITDLQGRAHMRDGSILDTLGSTDDWEDLRSIEVLMVGESNFAGRTMARQLRTHFFPRNVLSIAEPDSSMTLPPLDPDPPEILPNGKPKKNQN